MSAPELKELRKETMIKGTISKEGGAGLGLIDMAKRTGNQLLYNIEKINEEHSFFILTTTISGNQE